MRDAPVISDNPSTSNTPTSAPTKAINGVTAADMGTAAHAIATAKPALELTPMILGAASGLHRTV